MDYPNYLGSLALDALLSLHAGQRVVVGRATQPEPLPQEPNYLGCWPYEKGDRMQLPKYNGNY